MKKASLTWLHQLCKTFLHQGELLILLLIFMNPSSKEPCPTLTTLEAPFV